MELTWKTKEQQFPENYQDPLIYELYRGGELLGYLSSDLKIFGGKTLSWMLSSAAYHGWWGYELKCSLTAAKAALIEAATSERAEQHRAHIEALKRGDVCPRWESELKFWPADKPLFRVELRIPDWSTRWFMTYREAKERFIHNMLEVGFGRSYGGIGTGLYRGNKLIAYYLGGAESGVMELKRYRTSYEMEREAVS